MDSSSQRTLWYAVTRNVKMDCGNSHIQSHRKDGLNLLLRCRPTRSSYWDSFLRPQFLTNRMRVKSTEMTKQDIKIAINVLYLPIFATDWFSIVCTWTPFSNRFGIIDQDLFCVVLSNSAIFPPHAISMYNEIGKTSPKFSNFRWTPWKRAWLGKI